mmetsp:Transcript_27978/g.39318  ORF Transcript_27978/g.39318 Transcript_27978/m.39318 type:complete len:336 (+) Transcript_27978:618-1625(+)
MAVHGDKLSGQSSSHVEVLRVRLEGFVVAQDLGRAGRRHRRNQERVPQTMARDALLEAIPIPSSALGFPAPEIKLQLPFAGRRALECLVRALALCQLAGSLAGSEVDRLEDIFIQLACFITLEGHAEDQEGICQALDTQPYRPMAHVGLSRFRDRVVVAVDDEIQVPCGDLGDLIETVEVETVTLFGKGRQSHGGQVADSNFIFRGVLDDLGAEVGAVDGAEILLVRLRVRRILVQHVGRASLHLCFQNAKPQLLRLHRLAALAGLLQLFVQPVEFLAPDIHQPLACGLIEGLVGAEQGPVLVILDAAHEEVRNPKAVEKVSGPLLLLPVVLAQL